jgi:hypothetical protein
MRGWHRSRYFKLKTIERPAYRMTRSLVSLLGNARFAKLTFRPDRRVSCRDDRESAFDRRSGELGACCRRRCARG